MATRRRDDGSALTAYTAQIIAMHAMLERLKAYADDHGTLMPEDIHWGHVGDVTSAVCSLGQLAEQLGV